MAVRQTSGGFHIRKKVSKSGAIEQKLVELATSVLNEFILLAEIRVGAKRES